MERAYILVVKQVGLEGSDHSEEDDSKEDDSKEEEEEGTREC